MTDLQELMALLEKCAEGPWEPGVEGNGSPGFVYSNNSLGSAVAICYGRGLEFTVFEREQEESHAQVIAAAVNFLRSPAFAEMAANARRYEWLRECTAEQEDLVMVRRACGCGDDELFSGDELDAAIDAEVTRDP